MEKSANNCAWVRSSTLPTAMTWVDFDVAFNIYIIKKDVLFLSFTVIPSFIKVVR